MLAYTFTSIQPVAFDETNSFIDIIAYANRHTTTRKFRQDDISLYSSGGLCRRRVAF